MYGFQWLDVCFIFTFWLLSFSIFHNISQIYLKQENWCKKYFQERREDQILYHHFPSLLLQLSAFLKSGHAFPQALQHVATTPEGKILYKFIKIKLREGRVSPFHMLMNFLNIAIGFSLKNGTALSPLLKRLSELSRDQRHFQEKIKVLTFPVKAQIGVAILLPWFVLTIFGLLEENLLINAVTQVSGLVGFSTAILLELIALLWMQRILKT